MKILIADDHQLILEAVKSKLTEFVPDAQFVLAQNVDELLAYKDNSLDLIIVDLMMPGSNDQAHVDQMLKRYPNTPVLVLSGFGDAALMRDLINRGVRGYIPKAYSSELMISAVRLVLAGGVYLPPEMLRAEMAPERPVPPSTSTPSTPTVLTQQYLRSILTKRQLQVLELLSQGKPNKLIGRALDISEGTVKIHLAAIFRALNARNRTEAVIAAQAIEQTAPQN